MKRVLVAILIALVLTSCNSEDDIFKWVLTGKLTGMSCSRYYDMVNSPQLDNCLAVVKSAGPEMKQSFKVDKNYPELLGKQVDVTRVGNHKYRLTTAE